MIGGLIINFAGKVYLKPLIFLVGIAQASNLIIIIVFATFARNNEKAWVGWVIMICSLLVGVLVGYLLMVYHKIGGFVLVSWGGFNTGILVYNAILYKVNSEWALWGFSIGVGLLYVVLFYFFFDHLLIISTAIIGSTSAI